MKQRSYKILENKPQVNIMLFVLFIPLLLIGMPAQGAALEHEGFTLSVPYAEPQTVVVFAPEHETVVFQDSETEGNTVLSDVCAELNIRIAPGAKVLPELPLRFGLEIRDGFYADLSVWDSELQQFSEMLRVRDIGTENEKNVHLTLFVPPQLIAKLKGRFGNLSIVSWVDGTDMAAVKLSELMIVDVSESFPEESDDETRANRGRGIDKSAHLNKEFSNDYAGLEFDGGANIKLDKSGASVWVGGNAELRMLENEFEFMGADIIAAASVQGTESPLPLFTAELRFLEVEIYALEYDKYAKLSLSKSFTKKKEKKKTYIIEGVPVEVTGTAFGTLVLSAEFGVTGQKLFARMGPMVDAGLELTVVVGSTKYGVGAGVKGELHFIDDYLWAETTCSLRYRQNDHAVEGFLNFRVWNDLRAIQGKIGPYVKFLDSDFEYWWVLVDWSGYHRDDTLLNWSKSAIVAY